MSVKTDYENFKANRAHVQELLEKERENLRQIQNSYVELLKKQDELSKRSSKLAKPLLRKISKEIRQFKLKMSKSTDTIYNLDSELAELERNIELLSDDVNFYVQEQTDFMVTKLLDYVSNNSSNLAYNIETTFYILNKFRIVPYYTESLRKFIRDYEVNTGEFYIKRGTTLIAISEDFYFNKVFYDYEYDIDINGYEKGRGVIYREWFKEYLKLFISTLKSKIEKAFKGNKDFKVIFQDDSKFTLQLI